MRILPLLVLAGAHALRAQSFDTVSVTMVAPGVMLKHLHEATQPWDARVLVIDLRHRELQLAGARAMGAFRGRERVSDIVRRNSTHDHRVVAAVNGDFFILANGEGEDDQVWREQWIKGVPLTDSSRAAGRRVRTELAIGRDGRVMMDRFAFDAWVSGAGLRTRLHGLNAVPGAGQLSLFTSAYDAAAPADSTTRGDAELALVVRARHGDTLDLRPAGAVGAPRELRPSRDTVVLMGGAGTEGLLARLAGMRSVRVTLASSPDRGPLRSMMGGVGRLVLEGRAVGDSTAHAESASETFTGGRHPRTAIGISRDSLTVTIAVMDGRGESGSGMSMGEISTFMRDLGAWNAMNLDGGGSSTMVVDGRVVNHPSDREGERTVGMALLLFRDEGPSRKGLRGSGAGGLGKPHRR
ncbi:MAG: Protein of unknown function periplasmic [Gemmatimonadetes bacterium]|nr:Protein of unknown function periplasmic [Gemmatimonadota bacterium]